MRMSNCERRINMEIILAPLQDSPTFEPTTSQTSLTWRHLLGEFSMKAGCGPIISVSIVASLVLRIIIMNNSPLIVIVVLVVVILYV